MTLPVELVASIERAGYFPETALAAIARTIGTNDITNHLVRPETTFDGPEVRRHLTVLLLGKAHLFVVHLDDEVADQLNPTQVIVSTERIRLSNVRNVALAQVFDTDGASVASEHAEITVGISWGSQRRIDLERAWCDDTQCQVDHGYSGTSQNADVVLRVSAIADGRQAVIDALEFFDAVNAATQ